MNGSGPSREFLARILRYMSTDNDLPPDEEHFIGPSMAEITESVGALEIDPGTYTDRFYGKSSGAMLVQTAVNMKMGFKGKDVADSHAHLPKLRPKFWQVNQVSCYCWWRHATKFFE